MRLLWRQQSVWASRPLRRWIDDIFLSFAPSMWRRSSSSRDRADFFWILVELIGIEPTAFALNRFVETNDSPSRYGGCAVFGASPPGSGDHLGLGGRRAARWSN